MVSCIDFRFRRQLPDAIFQAFSIDDYDDIKLDGGAKNIVFPDDEGRRKALLDDIFSSLKAHQAKQILLLNHQNCGKYASEGRVFTDSGEERAFHKKELRLAGDITFRHFPDAKILLGYAWVDHDDIVRVDQIKSKA
ncbi:MAG: hypothetical protein Q7S66_05695 [bacterium]|nr:hypothetical protein [bacterium]